MVGNVVGFRRTRGNVAVSTGARFDDSRGQNIGKTDRRRRGWERRRGIRFALRPRSDRLSKIRDCTVSTTKPTISELRDTARQNGTNFRPNDTHLYARRLRYVSNARLAGPIPIYAPYVL